MIFRSIERVSPRFLNPKPSSHRAKQQRSCACSFSIFTPAFSDHKFGKVYIQHAGPIETNNYQPKFEHTCRFQFFKVVLRLFNKSQNIKEPECWFSGDSSFTFCEFCMIPWRAGVPKTVSRNANKGQGCTKTFFRDVYDIFDSTPPETHKNIF